MDHRGPSSSFSRRHRIATEHSALPGQTIGAVPGEPLYTSSRELAIRIAEVIADTPAQNTVVIDIHHTSTVADCFVICSGENERQLRAIHRDVTEQLEEDGTFPRRIEGTPASGWILIDYGDVVVHIFDIDQRTFYRLEEVWKDAPTLLAIQ
jgi:ribosome-associated protein